MTYDVQLIEVIGREGIAPLDVLWKCKGECWSATNPEDSITKHKLFIFPSGSEWYICTKCGATVMYTDQADREIALLPTEDQKSAKDDYKKFTKKIAKATYSHRSKRKSDMYGEKDKTDE